MEIRQPKREDTQAGKNRVVPIHSAILPFVEKRMKKYGCILPVSTDKYRKGFAPTLAAYGIDQSHTPPTTADTHFRCCVNGTVYERMTASV